jgi:23S rRNA maturation mini-RNase III
MLMQSKKDNATPQSILSTPSIQSNYSEFVAVDSSIKQLYAVDVTGRNIFRPTLQANVKVHYYNQSKGIDEDEEFCVTLDIYEDEALNWDSSDKIEECNSFSNSAPSSAFFSPISSEISTDRELKNSKKSLIDWVYKNERIETFRSISPRLSSNPYESLGEFRVRVKDILDDKKEQEIEKLQNRYEKKEQILLKRLKRAKERVTKEEADATKSMVDTGIAILGALFGRSSSAKLGRVLSKGSHAYKEREDISRAEEQVEAIKEEIEELSYKLEDKISDLALQYDVDNVEITESSLKPRKSDIEISRLSIVWVV